MRIIVFLSIAVSIILISCAKEEPEFTAFSPEAFAYDIGDSWEVIATARVKGIQQSENNGNFSASLSFNVDLVTPEGDTIISKFIDDVEKTLGEKMMDIQLEAQFELDETFGEGRYTVIFNIYESATGKQAKAVAEFDVVNE